ncbi:DEAD/DEAH box helicase family protein [Bradyrhizobium manausense]|uniref:DISARM system SNF2-like helicase DrmD n=1 Tax=Bradyrhizobium manausense TaxID=989370 RepID=UPI001BAC5499|nr:DISARM system SNF2-like helicase DrmD [Bradyrhizobium manausense]MBR0689897.1 DEAD/DEAH box helicase family protein [Bradyrhizobium manausense]
MSIQQGDFVEARGRQWLVETVDDADSDLRTVRLSSIADDAQGEQIEVLWDAEIGTSVLPVNSWEDVGRGAPDDPEVLAAHLRAIRWKSATAADRDLMQAPFRAGIRLDAYQLLPLRKALRLPRVNLLIADDVGLGKTVEAGLVVRELLLRRRIDFIVIAAPPAMTVQWKDELESKFGLTFDIIDRERIGELRRLRGFSVNPWTTGSRFIISHSLLTEEHYIAGLRDLLGEFRSRSLFILDEAHHAAPSAGGRYAIASQITRAVRELSQRFEHRLFLTATPHNGHSNSFAALLEMLDPQRFTRGDSKALKISPRDLEPVMVRRLKVDLRRLGEAFPERKVEAVPIAGLPADVPELDLWRRLAAYGELRKARLVKLPAQKAALAKLAFVGLQQRLLSSIPAFARTLKAHRKTLQRLLDGEASQVIEEVVQTFVDGSTTDKVEGLEVDDEETEISLDADEGVATEAASVAGAAGASAADLKREIAAVDEMLAIAETAALNADARALWLAQWIKSNCISGKKWNDRRLIVFTEWEDTRRWLERRLREAIEGTDRADDRIAVFTGATGQERREEVKAAFNADPAVEPLRILICTDAAREGINLQTRCHDLIHFDLPWNPSRLEQRNGRIDRKLQPAKQVFCRYFRYEQREADIVLEALVRKTEVIQEQLGSAGQVIEKRIKERMELAGIDRGEAKALAKAIEDETDEESLERARAEMDDVEKARYERIVREQQDLQNALERSRERVGVDPQDLRRVIGAALSRVGVPLDRACGESVGNAATFTLDPADKAFSRDRGWQDTFDDLRLRRRKRGESLNEWRKRAPVRAIAFESPRLPDGRDTPEIVQVHLEHRLVRRLMSRFVSQGFQQGLSRVTVIAGPGAQPRLVLMGRLAMYGAGAARLHEEIIPVAAIWTEADRGKKPLRALGESGEERTLNQLEQALRDARAAPRMAAARIQALVEKDIADLVPALKSIADERLIKVKVDLAKRGEVEAKSLAELLEQQRKRIAKANDEYDPNQYLLPGVGDEERREREADRRHWQNRLLRLEKEIGEEPARIRASYEVSAHRLEPVGLVYLWPATG